MLFSIIIPCFNAENYLSECLDSVLKQNFYDFEIILIDDGSVDTTPSICDEYASRYKNIKVIHKNNEGPLVARNLGIHKASGEYCLFIDADDLHAKDSLSILEKAIINHNEPDMILFNFVRFNGEKILSKSTIDFGSANIVVSDLSLLRKKILSDDRINSLCTKVVKTKILQKDDNNYDNISSVYAEDKAVSFYIFDKCNNYLYIDEYLYFYRTNPQSSTLRKITDFNDVLRRNTIGTTEMTLLYARKWLFYDAYDVEIKDCVVRAFISHVICPFLHNGISKTCHFFEENNVSESFFGFDIFEHLKFSKIGHFKKIFLVALLKRKRCLLVLFYFYLKIKY